MFEEISVGFWIRFFVLLVPFVIFIFIFAPTLKWKIMFSLAGTVGIATALMGKSMTGRS